MASYSGMTVKQMLSAGGRQSSLAQIPDQPFYSSNITGTPVPRVGVAQSGASTNAALGGIQPMQIVIIVVAIIAIGYLAHHLTYK